MHIFQIEHIFSMFKLKFVTFLIQIQILFI